MPWPGDTKRYEGMKLETNPRDETRALFSVLSEVYLLKNNVPMSIMHVYRPPSGRQKKDAVAVYTTCKLNPFQFPNSHQRNSSSLIMSPCPSLLLNTSIESHGFANEFVVVTCPLKICKTDFPLTVD